MVSITDSAAVLATDVRSMSDRELRAHLLALDRLVDTAIAARRSAVAEFDARNLAACDGAVNTGAWLRARCEMSRVESQNEVRTARRVRELPGVRAAAAEGELGAAKVALFATAADPARKGDGPLIEALRHDESMLVEHAKGLTVDQTRILLREWRARVQAAKGDAQEDLEQLRERRAVWLSQTLGGEYVLDGRLDAEAGAIVHRALEAMGEGLWRAEHATVLSGSEADALRTTPAQRRADALVELARRAMGALANDGSGAHASQPLVVVHAELDTLERRAGRHAEVETGGLLSGEAVSRLACDAGVARIVWQSDSTPVDLGVTSRVPSPAQRRALVRRDRGCVFPGCDRPPGWCHAHHIVHWAEGGATDLENLALLCSHHHHLVHEGGFGLTRRRRRDGTTDLIFTRPDGSVIDLATRLAA